MRYEHNVITTPQRTHGGRLVLLGVFFRGSVDNCFRILESGEIKKRPAKFDIRI